MSSSKRQNRHATEASMMEVSRLPGHLVGGFGVCVSNNCMGVGLRPPTVASVAFFPCMLPPMSK